MHLLLLEVMFNRLAYEAVFLLVEEEGAVLVLDGEGVAAAVMLEGERFSASIALGWSKKNRLLLFWHWFENASRIFFRLVWWRMFKLQWCKLCIRKNILWC